MDDRRWPTYKPRNLTLASCVMEGAPTGRGSFRVRDDEGNVYLDAIGGIGCLPLGHNDPEWTAALLAQAQTLVAASGPFYTEPQQALARDIVQRVPIRDAKVFLANTGTEVTEAAIKLATRATKRDVIVAFERAFHGRTLGSIALTANPQYRDPYVTLMGEDTGPRFASMNVVHVPYGDLAPLKEVFDRLGSRIAMVCLEPIQGEGGIHPARREFLLGVHSLCRTHGALLGLDEIQCGSGRTGEFSAWTTLVGSRLEFPVDIAWYAKALGGGFPIAVCAARSDLAEHMGKGSHGSTFGGNPLACGAALATLKLMDERDLFGSAGRQLSILRRIAETDPEPQVLDVRGSGAMIGIELGDEAKALAVVAMMQELRVLALTSGASAIRCLLPYHAGEGELREVWQSIREALRRVATRS